MGKTEKIQVGTVLYEDNLRNGIVKHKVTSVGNKYFYCNGLKYKHSLDTLFYKDPNYTTSNVQLYRTEQDILDRREQKEIYHSCSVFFRSFNDRQLTLDQLRRIKNILDEKN